MEGVLQHTREGDSQARQGAEIRKIRKVRKIKHKKERQKLRNEYEPEELQVASVLLYASPQQPEFPQVGRLSLSVSGTQPFYLLLSQQLAKLRGASCLSR